MRPLEDHAVRHTLEIITVEEEEPSGESYEELFAVFSEGPERWLKRVSLLLALLLAVVQLALLVPAIRETLVRTERLEGVPFQSGYDSEER